MKRKHVSILLISLLMVGCFQEMQIVNAADVIDRSVQYDYDALQDFYINYPIDLSYSEAVAYITIYFEYEKNENSNNDEPEKYSFKEIEYDPIEGYFSFSTNASGEGIIKRLGTDIEQDLEKEICCLDVALSYLLPMPCCGHYPQSGNC